MLSLGELNLHGRGVAPCSPAAACDGIQKADGLAAVHGNVIGACLIKPPEGEAQIIIPCRLHIDVKFKKVPIAYTVKICGAHRFFKVKIAAEGGALIGIGKDLAKDDFGYL